MIGQDDDCSEESGLGQYTSPSSAADGAVLNLAPADESRRVLQRLESTYSRLGSSEEHAQLAKAKSFEEVRNDMDSLIIPAALGSPFTKLRDLVKSIDCLQFMDYFVAAAIESSLTKTAEEKKRLSANLTFLYDSKLLSVACVKKGFEKLIQNAPNLRDQVPNVCLDLMTYFNCAHADSIVEDSFFDRLPETFLMDLTDECVAAGQDFFNEELDPDTASPGEGVRRKRQKLQEAKKAMFDAIQEGFQLGSFQDCRSILIELHNAHVGHEFVRLLLKGAMSRNNFRLAELVTKTFNDFYGSEPGCLSPDDILLGFVRVLAEMDDLILDIPEAPDFYAKFLVRAIVDDMTPPIFLYDYARLEVGGPKGREILERVRVWLVEESNHAQGTRFAKIWSGADPERQEARLFREALMKVIAELYDGRSLEVTTKELNRLEMTPDQATVCARRLMMVAMERDSHDLETAADLIKYMIEKKELEPENLTQALDQLHRSLDDMRLDLPLIGSIFPELLQKLVDKQLLSEADIAKRRLLASRGDTPAETPADSPADALAGSDAV